MNTEYEEKKNLEENSEDLEEKSEEKSEDLEEESEEKSEEKSEDLEEKSEDLEEKSEDFYQIRSETVQNDYTNDFYILENIGYLQLSLLGCLVFYFILSLVYKYIKSFF